MNRSTLDKILADDFLDSGWKGKLRTKAQVLKELVAAAFIFTAFAGHRSSAPRGNGDCPRFERDQGK
jgi:hypothetical protein